MLTDCQKEKCANLLLNIPTNDVLAITDAVTNKLIKPETKDEAILAILQFTNSPEELLRRRKLKRSYIFNYLRANNIIVPVNSEKHKLVKTTLTYWGLEPSKDEFTLEDEEMEEIPESYSPQVNVNYINVNVNINGVKSCTIVSENSQHTDGQTLAEHFVPWYFQTLNSLCPNFSPRGGTFGAQHFFPNCILRLSYVANHQPVNEILQGSEAVVKKLGHFVQNENILFNPNTSKEGLRGFINSHGFVIVCVCGTVHQNEICVGIFEQAFALIQDPQTESNWKIQKCELRLEVAQVIAPPTLVNSQLLLLHET